MRELTDERRRHIDSLSLRPTPGVYVPHYSTPEASKGEEWRTRADEPTLQDKVEALRAFCVTVT